MHLHNTLSGRKEEFTPLNPERVTMYVCGPTVYNYAHIGNFRPVMVFDLLFRVLRDIYGDDAVLYAANVTDVDDKINKKAFDEGVAIKVITDRYLAAFLSDRVGAEFAGRISGVQRFGVFVKLDETGADGLIPIRDLGREFFHYDQDAQMLTGADTGQTIGIGQRVTVRLAEATPVTGGLVLELLTLEGAALAQGRGPKRGGYAPRKPGKFAPRDAKIKRKVERKRR